MRRVALASWAGPPTPWRARQWPVFAAQRGEAGRSDGPSATRRKIYAMPVFDMIETVLVMKFRFRPSLMLRLIARSVYVGFTMFVAITIPFFGALLSFFGGFAFAPTTYFLPCIMWLRIYKPKPFSISWFTNWICIVLGVLLMVLSPIGGLRQIILNAKTYHFYE